MTPRATYRLQFREGMTFERAAELVPYLAELEISHLYASPIFAAAPGSVHGYDVVDHQQLDPVLGGEEGFRLLARALKEHGLGLILDIVPNHMAASTANRWWCDVLKHGSKSRHARHFDIDWDELKLLLPILGEPYGEALAEGKLRVVREEAAGEPMLAYFDLRLPLAPGSFAAIAGDAPIEEALGRLNADRNLLHKLHEAQIWRLAYWRLAREALTYRRFFEIADLVGVRVEDAKVFADVHELPLQFIEQGIVDGLRIDHIDGLADPKEYLANLHRASGLDYVVVEKILGVEEELPSKWHCAGTTGYEVARLVTGLQIDARQKGAMTKGWSDFTGDDPDFASQVLAAKRRILTLNLAGELGALVRIAQKIAERDLVARDYGRDALRLAIIELAAALPVYRSYIDRDGASHQDRTLIGRAVAQVERDRVVEDNRVVRFIASLLLDPPPHSELRQTFIARFQQTTGPLTAKAVEDTVFYRYNRLIGLNEVGAEPDEFGLEPASFHAAMESRAQTWPRALSATATHDTKRGEDARARLAVISEMPREWSAAVARWHDALADVRQELPMGSAPSPGAEWLLYQALAGAWPLDLSPQDEDGLQELCERIVAFMLKALREAKLRTSWTDPSQRYEAVVEQWIRTLFAREQRDVLRDIRAVIAAIAPAGFINTLAQLALKLTVPGVPDIYQGCELMDFSMVDPDNRRPVDFALRRRLLAQVRHLSGREAMTRWREGAPKLWLTEKLLRLRTERPQIFAEGRYEPIEAVGERAANVVAFARVAGDRRVVVAVPRLVLRHLDMGEESWLGSAFSQTMLRLPHGPDWQDALSGSAVEDREVCLARLWESFPVAVLTAG